MQAARHYSMFKTAGFLLSALTLSVFAPGSNAVQQAPLFASDEVLEVSIEGPVSTLIKTRSDENYLEGLLRYSDQDGASHELSLKFRARGNFRAQRKVCPMPPVRLNFRKSEVKGSVFAGQDKLKLVTHCRAGASRAEQLVLKEYLAYRILGLHTDASFRVRLLRINWIDTDNDSKALLRYGFLIEDKRQLAKRLGMEVLDVPSSSYSRLDKAHASLVVLFQYLIGNTDFSLIRAPEGERCCHNAVLFSDAGGSHVAIPYDFDVTGIVDAPYAIPSEQFRIKSVRQRVYRGHCELDSMLNTTLELFRDRHTEVMELITAQVGFSKSTRKRVTRYLDEFYRVLFDPKKSQRRFGRTCG